MSSFDRSSGLVFRETVSDSIRSMKKTWASHSRGKRVDPSKFRYVGQGCASLESMALRVCIQNIDNMEPEALQWLTWSYARRLYDHLKSNDTLTFNTWSLFQAAFPNDIDRHARFRFHEVGIHPSSFGSRQLPSIVDRLSKLDVSMLTFLSIRCFDLISEDLAALTKIKTLAVLALEVERVADTSVDPIRDWGRSVLESGAFQKLRVLVFSSYRGIQRDSFLKHMSSFKNLSLIGIYDQDKGPETMGGWVDWSTGSPRHMVSAERTPADIWDDRGSEGATKMRQLYDLSLTISQETPQVHTYRSLAMTYDSKNRSTLSGSVRWFFRELKDVPGKVIKRPQEERNQEEKRENHGKKRKVRDNKKVDVNSLLGSFS